MSAAPLQLDYRRPPSSPWRWLGWLLLALAAVAAALVADRYERVAHVHEVVQARADQLAERLRAARPDRPKVAPDTRTLAELARARAIVDELTVPWADLFEAVEAADAKPLGLLAVTPNARDRSLRMAGEARSVVDVLGYVDRMASQPALGQVHLLGYQTVVRDGVPVVSFTLAASWRQQP